MTPSADPSANPGRRARISRSLLFAGLGGAILLLALVVALRPAPVPVDVEAVTRGPIAVTIDEEGKTRVKDLFVVSAPVTGKLRRSALDPGDKVEKDKTVIAVIEPAAPVFLDARTRKEAEALVTAAQAAVTLAEAEVRQAETEASWAERELKRAEDLVRSSTVAERTVERARLELDKQRAGLARAKANLDVRRSELASAQAHLVGPEIGEGAAPAPTACCVEVRAPQSGQVLRELQESERVVLAGSPLFEIGNVSSIDIVVELLSSDAVRIAPGAKATVEGAGLPKPIQAHVRRVEPSGFTKVSALGIEEQRVRVYLDIDSPAEAWSRLGHDYRVYAHIIQWSSEDALRVPLSALFRSGSDWAAYVLDGGRARQVAVSIRHRNDDFAEVINGLKPGDRVVLHPGDRIASGTRIAPRSNSR